jgi:hypothetical protein
VGLAATIYLAESLTHAFAVRIGPIHSQTLSIKGCLLDVKGEIQGIDAIEYNLRQECRSAEMRSGAGSSDHLRMLARWGGRLLLSDRWAEAKAVGEAITMYDGHDEGPRRLVHVCSGYAMSGQVALAQGQVHEFETNFAQAFAKFPTRQQRNFGIFREYRQIYRDLRRMYGLQYTVEAALVYARESWYPEDMMSVGNDCAPAGQLSETLAVVEVDGQS